MSRGELDEELLAERTAAVARHLDRVAEHLPSALAGLEPMSSSTDTVALHLWQADQVVIDLAVSDLLAFLVALRDAGRVR